MSPSVLLLAGGGGHTGYAYAIAKALWGKCDVHTFVPEGDELSFQRLSMYSTVTPLNKPRGPTTPATGFVAGLFKSGFKSFRLVGSEFKVVVSTGSNFCIPPSLAAILKGKRIVNIESSVRFTRSSQTARILRHFAEVTVLQWEEQKALFRDGRVFGPLVPPPEAPITDGGYILVTGGTFGHKLLFDAVSATGIPNVILQTGHTDQAPYKQAHPEWKILDFSSTFYTYLASARVVVTHFGETALEAALVYRKPTVIAVNPEWTRTVGLKDAQMLTEKLGGILLTELTPRAVEEGIEESLGSKLPEVKNGSEPLAEEILVMLGRR